MSLRGLCVEGLFPRWYYAEVVDTFNEVGPSGIPKCIVGPLALPLSLLLLGHEVKMSDFALPCVPTIMCCPTTGS